VITNPKAAPYYRPQWGFFAKRAIDILYDPEHPENRETALIFSSEIMGRNKRTLFGMFSQGSQYLADVIDPSYRDKVNNFKVSMKGRAKQVTVSLYSAKTMSQIRGEGMMEQAMKQGLVATEKLGKLSETLTDDDTGEDVEVDTTVGDAEWKRQILEFIETSSPGDRLALTQIQLTPKHIKLVEYYLRELGGEGEYTVLYSGQNSIGILHGKTSEQLEVKTLRSEEVDTSKQEVRII
jgi:hypothetical protein